MFLRALIFLSLIPLAHADDKIVVTATRSESSDAPFSVNRVEGERWTTAGGNAEQALATVPGVSFVTSGAAGQTRSLLLRGAKAEHTLVLIDGIPVNDPLSPSRAFDFGQVPVSELDRIEVLKGPQSVLYGSDAMGGVVQLFTKKGVPGRARVEGGSYGTVKADLSAMGFRAGYHETKGFSAADEREGNTEADGYRAWNLGGTKDFALNDRFLMRLNAQYQDNRTDTDRNGGRGGDSRNTSATHSQFLLREENVVILPEEAELTVAGSYSNHDRTDNTNGADYYKADLWKAEAVARKPNVGAHSFTLGAEYGEESGRSSQTLGGRQRFREGAFYAQDELRFGRFTAVAGGRLDFHSVSDNAATGRFGIGYWLVPELLRAKASLGSGFKAPSLYQTYSVYGSPLLKPERSLGGELGLELTAGDWRSELNAFGNRFRDQIDFNLLTNRYFNQSRAETYGLEWSLERRLGRFRAGNSFTLLRAVDPATGLRLLRRPLWTNTLEVGLSREKQYGATLLGRFVGEREDVHPVLYTRQNMPAFFTLGANFFHAIDEGIRVVARGENLFDRRYQETSGYGVAGLSGYAGIEADL